MPCLFYVNTIGACMNATETVPGWVKDAVFYQIFPDRFANGDPSNDPAGAEQWGAPPKGNNFFGGDLQGIMDRTPYLKELGINTLYLNPIFEATTNHKYNTKDYLKIDPSFGTNELFDRFSQHVRERNIRLVLDGVFNHVGTAFEPFADVVKNGATSPYASWFNIYSFPVKEPRHPNYECWWGYGSLPKLMAQHPEVKKYLLSVAEQWTPKIDGWRLDVANEVPHEFWKEFRIAVRSWNPECYIVGELWEDASPWLQGDEFDATMNYRFRHACLEFFAKDVFDAAAFDSHLASTRALYSEEHNFALQNLLGSHDTERILTLCNGEEWRLRLAAVFQMTYIGAPMIYYGDEIGMEGGKDPDCRRCMPWSKKEWNEGLLKHYKDLIALRNELPALRRGSYTTLLADPKKDIIAFERRFGPDVVIIAINKKKTAASVTLPAAGTSGTAKERLTGEMLTVSKEQLRFTIPARGARIFTLHTKE